MADTKVSALTAAVSAAGANELPINEAGVSKKVTVAQITTYVNANITLGAALATAGFAITSTGLADVSLTSSRDVIITLGDALGADDLLIKDSAAATVASINSDGALSAVSFGGITEANLLDKSAVETISGAYTFSDQISIDNLNINGNTIAATLGAVNITPVAGSAIVLDGTINIDAGVVTGATSITSTAFVGALTGNASGSAATVTGASQTAITSAANLATVGSITSGTWSAAIGTVTGAIDAGGATSLEIPNGAGGTTVDATGEVCVDSTSKTVNFYDGAAEKVLQPETSKGVTIETPTASEDISLFFTDYAITITKMICVMVGTTPSVTWTIRHGTDRSAAGAEVVTSGTTTTSITTGSVVTTFNDATIIADSFVWLETTATSGTVTNMNLTIEYTQDP